MAPLPATNEGGSAPLNSGGTTKVPFRPVQDERGFVFLQESDHVRAGS